MNCLTWGITLPRKSKLRTNLHTLMICNVFSLHDQPISEASCKVIRRAEATTLKFSLHILGAAAPPFHSNALKILVFLHKPLLTPSRPGTGTTRKVNE